MPLDGTNYSPAIDVVTSEGRLKHLITVLRGVPKRKLNMSYWTCGSSACAAGWAGMDSLFIKQGFFTNMYNVNYHDADENTEYEALHACAKFFQLPYNQAAYIFMPSAYEDRPLIAYDVIQHIEHVLNKEVEYYHAI